MSPQLNCFLYVLFSLCPFVNNTILSCPLRGRCNCQCQAKIVETPVQTILYISSMHTAADHVATKNQSKYLKRAQRNMIATAVKIAPLQSAGELIQVCNVQNSPTKEIDSALRQSVVRLVRKERREINTVLLEGVSFMCSRHFHRNGATCTCSSVTVQNVSNLPRVCMYYKQGWCVIHQSRCQARAWV